MSELSSRLSRSIRNSELGKLGSPDNLGEQIDRRLEAGGAPTLERAVYRLFSIDILGLIRNKVALCKNFHMQPSEIDRMCFYEYEYFIEEVQEIIKKEEEANKANEKKYGSYNPNKMYRDAQAQMRSSSKSTGVSMPKSTGVSMPKMPKMPSMPKL